MRREGILIQTVWAIIYAANCEKATHTANNVSEAKHIMMLAIMTEMTGRVKTDL